jgi:hypothetical protein
MVSNELFGKDSAEKQDAESGIVVVAMGERVIIMDQDIKVYIVYS